MNVVKATSDKVSSNQNQALAGKNSKAEKLNFSNLITKSFYLGVIDNDIRHPGFQK